MNHIISRSNSRSYSRSRSRSKSNQGHEDGYDPAFKGYRVKVADLNTRINKYDLEKEFDQYGRVLDLILIRRCPTGKRELIEYGTCFTLSLFHRLQIGQGRQVRGEETAQSLNLEHPSPRRASKAQWQIVSSSWQVK